MQKQRRELMSSGYIRASFEHRRDSISIHKCIRNCKFSVPKWPRGKDINEDNNNGPRLAVD